MNQNLKNITDNDRIQLQSDRNSSSSEFKQVISGWVSYIALGTFRIDDGQSIEYLYPAESLSVEEKKSIAMISFPDTGSLNQGNDLMIEYCFRMKIRDCQQLGFVFFFRKKDSSIDRGYIQKSIVIITKLPLIHFYQHILNLLGEFLYENKTPYKDLIEMTSKRQFVYKKRKQLQIYSSGQSQRTPSSTNFNSWGKILLQSLIEQKNETQLICMQKQITQGGRLNLISNLRECILINFKMLKQVSIPQYLLKNKQINQSESHNNIIKQKQTTGSMQNQLYKILLIHQHIQRSLNKNGKNENSQHQQEDVESNQQNSNINEHHNFRQKNSLKINDNISQNVVDSIQSEINNNLIKSQKQQEEVGSNKINSNQNGSSDFRLKNNLKINPEGKESFGIGTHSFTTKNTNNKINFQENQFNQNLQDQNQDKVNIDAYPNIEIRQKQRSNSLEIQQEYSINKQIKQNNNLTEILKLNDAQEEGLFQEINVFRHVSFNKLHLLWPIWEMILVNQPFLLTTNTPSECSAAILGFISLISPLQFAGDYRPYFTVYDTEYKKINQEYEQNMLKSYVLGTCNPLFQMTLKNFPVIIGFDSKSEQHQLLEQKKSKKPLQSIKYNKMKSDIIADYKELEKLLLNSNSPEAIAINNTLVRKHFRLLTNQFLEPINKYLDEQVSVRIILIF